MVLTRTFKETIQVRLLHDPAFHRELLWAGIDSLIAGDMETAKIVLFDISMHAPLNNITTPEGDM